MSLFADQLTREFGEFDVHSERGRGVLTRSPEFDVSAKSPPPAPSSSTGTSLTGTSRRSLSVAETSKSAWRAPAVAGTSDMAVEIALHASLDTQLSTEAIRVFLGIHDRVVECQQQARANSDVDVDETAAFISLAEVYAYSGVDPKTVPTLLDDLAKLGLLQVSEGRKGKYSQEKSRGYAAAWDLSSGTYGGITAPSGLGYLLHPCDERWSKGKANSAGFRVALVLLALFGLEETTISAKHLAEVMGKAPSTTTVALQSLATLWVGLVEKRGRRWAYTPTFLAHCLEDPSGYLPVEGVAYRFEWWWAKRERWPEEWTHYRETKRNVPRMRDHLARDPVL